MRKLTNQQKVPTIRKIFRRGDGAFICGICRGIHPSTNAAYSCLNQCWQKAMNLYPLVKRKNAEKQVVYRCRFCSRDYDSEQQGLLCAADCKLRGNRLHMVESKILQMPVAPLNRPRRVFAAPVATQFVAKFKLRRFSYKSADQDQQKSGQSPAEVAEQEGAKTENANGAKVPAANSVERRHRDSYKKEWVRKDAKYECCYCYERYFTRMEVQKCFKGHFDEHGYEIDPSKSGSP